ncbi:MAG: hypothetical protein EB141_05620 [Verrucomicrobia bacterium]|nr:hypothetical protein [Verrucomicrobiota bacterium]
MGGLLAGPALLAQQRTPGSTKPASKSPTNFQGDAEVLIESQERALEMAKDLSEKSDNPRTQVALSEVVKQMERALKLLEIAKTDPKQLESAVAAQQASYQALLKLAEREFKVTQSKSGKSKSQSPSDVARQQQVNELELKMSKNRYEEQKQAKAEPEQSPEQRENLQMMSRLRELAQRQNDLNERLKELQTALQEAKTEPEKEEIRRRLKRLREEEQQMLAELDELKQRAEKPENQQRMADLKNKLEQTRQAAQKAAEQMEKGNVSQALASGTRTQRDLQEMRDDLRKKNASQFSEDMKQLRQEARDIAQKQEALGKELDATPQSSKRKSLTEPDAKSEVPKELAEQNQRLANLMERATQIAEQSEDAEPVLHRQLYDAIRKQAQAEAQNLKATKDELVRRGMMSRGLNELLEKASEAGGTKSLEIASQLAKNGLNLPAASVEQRARKSIDELKRGVERAAESVLGDEAEALKQAAKTLDSLARQLESELARGEGKSAKADGEAQSAAQPGEPKEKPGQATRDEGKAPGKQAGKGGEGKPIEPKPGEGKEGQSTKAGKAGDAQAGKEPGEGQGKPGQPSKSGEGKEGSKPGQGGKPGEGKPSEGKEGTKSGQGSQPGGQEGKPSPEAGKQAGKSGGQGQGQDTDAAQRNRNGGVASASQRGGADGSHSGEYQAGGNRRGGRDNFLNNFNAADRTEASGPITGAGFDQFSDRLRDAEEMVDATELRNQLQTVRERLRMQRVEFKREAAEPKWDLVRMQILKPLVEVKQRIEEEIAKRDNREAMVPIDRDPVPGKFSELVKKYYENLGKDGGK